jgi:pimeloyl-ACP methyl ester carboxylesterase
LYNIDTLSVARDFEALRQALDEDKITFLGISYGTLIGQTYAKLYPDKYRAMALDAIVDHNQSDITVFALEASTYERTFEQFAKWCNSASDCALHGQDVEKVFASLVNNATKEAIPAPGCDDNSSTPCHKNITGQEILFAVQDMLQFKEPFAGAEPGWAGLSELLAAAAQGNGTGLSQAYGSGFLGESNSSDTFAGLAVTCLDFIQDDKNYSDVAYQIELGKAVAPLTKGACQSYGYNTQCIGFGHKATNPQGDMSIDNEGFLPILLTGSIWDPSTSIINAESVRSHIVNVSLAIRDGDGHTSVFLHGEMAGIISSYLVNETVPEPNTIVAT